NDTLVGWTTFPERLEDNGVAWKIYQNELSVQTGFNEEEDAWLSNFGCNVMEYFAQYHVRANKMYRDYLKKQQPLLPDQITMIKQQLAAPYLSEGDTAKLKKRLQELTDLQQAAEEERKNWDREVFENLSEREKSL